MTTDEQNEAITSTGAPPSSMTRERARNRLQAKRDFWANVVAYVVVNAFFVLAWAVTGGGYFWPVWIMGAWGVGVVMHAYNVFVQRPITESDVDRELRRQP
jgi:uncharacterized membrane protein YecN with MAPEG domain